MRCGFVTLRGPVFLSFRNITSPAKQACQENYASVAGKNEKTKKSGSPGRTRTSDPAVNSRLLYQLSYRGTWQANQDLQTAHAIANARGSFQIKKCTKFRNCIPAHFVSPGAQVYGYFNTRSKLCPAHAAIQSGAPIEATKNQTREKSVLSAAFTHRSVGNWRCVDSGRAARISARTGVLDDPARVSRPFS